MKGLRKIRKSKTKNKKMVLLPDFKKRKRTLIFCAKKTNSWGPQRQKKTGQKKEARVTNMLWNVSKSYLFVCLG